MGALLDDASPVEDQNFIAELAGGQAVADVDGGFVAGDLVELGVDLCLGHGIEGGGGLGQDDEGRVLIQRPGDGDLLGLAAGDLDAVLTVVLIKLGVQPLGEALQPGAEACVCQSLFHPLGVIVYRARHIAAQALGDQLEVLEDDGENAHIVVIPVFPNVDAV